MSEVKMFIVEKDKQFEHEYFRGIPPDNITTTPLEAAIIIEKATARGNPAVMYCAKRYNSAVCLTTTGMLAEQVGRATRGVAERTSGSQAGFITSGEDPKEISIDFTEVPAVAELDRVVVKGCDTNKVSDGYHTFGELYEHRITLFMALCKQLYENEFGWRKNCQIWRSERHSDGQLAYGGDWFVLGIGEKPGEQITYHLPKNRFWSACDSFATTLDQAPEWDGHTPEDVLERITKLLIL